MLKVILRKLLLNLLEILVEILNRGLDLLFGILGKLIGQEKYKQEMPLLDEYPLLRLGEILSLVEGKGSG